MIGTTLKGKYEIKSLVAESSFYEVFSAVETETGTSVMVKVLREEMSRNPERTKFFSDEVKNFAKLSHPNVAQILDFDLIDERPFLVTQPIEGTEFRSWIKGGRIPFSRAIHAIIQIGEILQTAFESGISCRNLKTSNILRSPDGKLKILSFSLPRIKLVEKKESELSSGTQSDLFFLGSALYEILTGESPIRRRGGIYEMWDDRLRKALRINYPELNPDNIEKVVSTVEKTFTREIKIRFSDHQPFLKTMQELYRLGEKLEKTEKPVLKVNRLASASAVVDAIHGRIDMPGPAEKIIEFTAISGTAGRGGKKPIVGASLALAENYDALPKEQPVFGRPILQLIKGGRDATKSLIWKYSEDPAIHKNPVILMGTGILLMLCLVLFW